MALFQHNELVGSFRVHGEHSRDDYVARRSPFKHPETAPSALQPNSNATCAQVGNYSRRTLHDVDVVVGSCAFFVVLLNSSVSAPDPCLNGRSVRAAQATRAPEPRCWVFGDGCPGNRAAR